LFGGCAVGLSRFGDKKTGNQQIVGFWVFGVWQGL
jgi:hypothetical protein